MLVTPGPVDAPLRRETTLLGSVHAGFVADFALQALTSQEFASPTAISGVECRFVAVSEPPTAEAVTTGVPPVPR
jgi:hypothetical protein